MGDTREVEQHLSTQGALQPLGLDDDHYHEFDLADDNAGNDSDEKEDEDDNGLEDNDDDDKDDSDVDYDEDDDDDNEDDVREGLEAPGPLLSPLGLHLEVTDLNRGVEYR